MLNASSLVENKDTLFATWYQGHDYTIKITMEALGLM